MQVSSSQAHHNHHAAAPPIVNGGSGGGGGGGGGGGAVRPSDLIALHTRVQGIRNVCILAHVDHGKTTLTDNLIVSNGIISQRLAGKVRYMDSRPDEARRGITMKSSSISLLYRHDRRDTAQPEPIPYLINVIDSPGHVDFSSEVSTAVRVTDGALVVVDVVEGVCIQTESVLRQAKLEGVKPVLVLNKMDRLVLEMNYTPAEAYQRLHQVLTAVNAACASLWTGEQQEFFSPLRGNVVFASSIHGWAFSLFDFARLFSQKLGMKQDVLLKTLWGDFYLGAGGKVVTTPPGGGNNNNNNNNNTMFAQLCLKQIWEVYHACVAKDSAKLEKMQQVLQIKVPPRDMRTQDRDVMLGAMLSRWLPLSDAVLAMVVEVLPGPRESQCERTHILCTPLAAEASQELQQEHARIVEAVKQCDPNGPVVAFISKVFPSEGDQGGLYEAQRRVQGISAVASSESSSSSSTTSSFIAFCRIFSGTLRRGDSVHLLGPRYDPRFPERFSQLVTVEQLYLLMGRALEPLESVGAGNVFGIGSISQYILKTATLCGDRACTPFSVMPSASHPIVRVAVEPKHSYELAQLVAGLELLNQADPCVQVSVTEAGEHLLTAAGEMHMELCLRDLRERYAKVEIEASKPIVPFRESISKEDSISKGLTATTTTTTVVKALPLPPNVVELLWRCHDEPSDVDLQNEMSHAGSKWALLLPHLCAIGKGGNMIFNRSGTVIPTLESGFVLATSRGPLCEEPIMGVAFIVEVVGDELSITDVRDLLRQAFLCKSPRLYEAMYICDVRTTEKFLGKVSTVLARRRADIFQQDYDTEHSVLTLRALMPVRESFGLYEEMIAECSGGASIHLMMHGWRCLDMDPFEVLDDEGGALTTGKNLARQLLDEARRRKGLPVEEKLVEGGDKQRTLSKKK